MSNASARTATDTMDVRRRLANYVDTGLSREEQETAIMFFGGADAFQIVTYSPTMVRSLLRHASAEIEWVYAMEDGERGRRVHDLSEFAGAEVRSDIEGIEAHLPVGALTIKGSPRRSNRHSSIITTPEEIADLDDVFQDNE